MLAAGCWQCSLRAVLSTLSLSGVWCPVSPSSPPPNIRRHPEAAAVRRGGGVQGGSMKMCDLQIMQSLAVAGQRVVRAGGAGVLLLSAVFEHHELAHGGWVTSPL